MTFDAPPRVTVIIPVLDDFERLAVCLEALRRQSWSEERLEVLVVDNGSCGDITQVTKSFQFVRLLYEATPGSYAARNAGLDRATGNVIAFTDSDCQPEPNWLSEGVAAIERLGPNAIVGGDVVLFADDGERPTIAEEFELALGFSQRSYIEEKHYSVTANLFTTPEVFARVGRFDATLKSGGDKEWGNRAHARGIRMHYEPAAVVRHPARREMRELLKKRARVIGGHYSIMKARYPEWLAFSLLFGRSCLPPLRRIMGVKKSAKTSTRHRSLVRSLKVAAVGASLQAYSALELVRLKLGKPPVR